MGGQNHQPCSSYLPESTDLSRHISRATVHLEQGNIRLEEIILGELNGGKPSANDVKNVVEQLQQSSLVVRGAIVCCDELKAKMDANGYQDLPPARTLDLVAIGQELSEHGVVDQAAWNRMAELHRDSTFYSVLAHHRGNLEQIVDRTNALVVKVMKLAEVAEDSGVEAHLEGNTEFNIKIEFGVLYTRWNEFRKEFLASSLVSTEIWYASQGLNPLSHGIKAKQTATA